MGGDGGVLKWCVWIYDIEFNICIMDVIDVEAHVMYERMVIIMVEALIGVIGFQNKRFCCSLMAIILARMGRLGMGSR